MTLAIYARVSTSGQSAMQLHELRQYVPKRGCKPDDCAIHSVT